MPLDSHPDFGNNAQLSARLGLIADGRFADQGLGWVATLGMSLSLEHFSAMVENAVGRKPFVFGNADKELRRVAWCTGGVQGYFEEAIAAGADVYVSGEVSEQTMHIAAGHHATERYGVQAVGAHLSEQFDIDNPV